MDKRINSRFTLKRTENPMNENTLGFLKGRNSEMSAITDDSREIKSGICVKLSKNSNANKIKGKNLNRTIEKFSLFANKSNYQVDNGGRVKVKRQNPYNTPSSNRNPKDIKSGHDYLKRNATERNQVFNRRSELVKARGKTNISNKYRKVKSEDKKVQNKAIIGEEEKYEKEKRKSEITNKLQRFKSSKKILEHEIATDDDKKSSERISKNFESELVCTGEYKTFITDMENDQKEVLNNMEATKESFHCSVNEMLLHDVLKMADDELQKSNDLVEIIKKMSSRNLNINPEKILCELETMESLKVDVSVTGCVEDLSRMIPNACVESTDFTDLSSRSKYTLLEPVDMNQPIRKSSSLDLSYRLQVEDEEVDIEEEEEDRYSTSSLPDSISECFLNLNPTDSIHLKISTPNYIFGSASKEDEFITSRTEINRKVLADTFTRSIESHTQLRYECDSDGDNINEDATNTVGINRNSEEVVTTENTSESDECLRDWKCNDTKNVMSLRKVNSDEKELYGSEEHSTSDRSDSEHSELDDEKLFLIAANKLNIDGNCMVTTDVFENPKQLEDKPSITNLKTLLISSDNSNELLAEKSELDLSRTSDHEDHIDEVISNTNFCESLNSKHDISDHFKNSASYEDLKIVNNNFCTNSKEIPTDIESKNILVDEKIRFQNIDSKCSNDGSGSSYFSNINVEITHPQMNEVLLMINQTSKSPLCDGYNSDDGSRKGHDGELVGSRMSASDDPSDGHLLPDVAECINDEFIYMLLNEYIEVGLNCKIKKSNETDLQCEDRESYENIVMSEDKLTETKEDNSKNYSTTENIDQIDEKLLQEFETDVLTPLPSETYESVDVYENDCTYACLLNQCAILETEMPSSFRYMFLFGNGAEVIKNSSISSLIGVSAAMLILAVGVLYFWHSASGIIQ